MSPCETLLESPSLIVEYGRIPLGDKLKITKTVQRQQTAMHADNKHMAKSKELFGLEKYHDFEASMIMNFAKGDSKWEIEYGIEQFEDAMGELERMVASSTLKDTKSKAAYKAGSDIGRRERDPTMQLLRSFGYLTFDYTRDKQVTASSVTTQPSSYVPAVNDVLFGNLGVEEERGDDDLAHSGMYS